jgi:hypothetical protein
MEEIDWARVREHLQNRRQHAPFFEAPGTSSAARKQNKEVGVVLEWLYARYGDPELHMTAVEPWQRDPPDVIVRQKDGTNLGIEVRELVDECRIKSLAVTPGKPAKKPPKEHLEFRGETLQKELLRIIERKAINPWNCNAGFRRILLIFSDERQLDPQGLENSFPGTIHTFDEIWLLIPEIRLAGAPEKVGHCSMVCLYLESGANNDAISGNKLS